MLPQLEEFKYLLIFTSEKQTGWCSKSSGVDVEWVCGGKYSWSTNDKRL